MKKIILLLVMILPIIHNQAFANDVNLDYQQCKIELGKCPLANQVTNGNTNNDCVRQTLEHSQSCHQTWNKVIDLIAPFFKLLMTIPIVNFSDFYLLNYQSDNVCDDAILTPQGELIEISGFSYAKVDFDKIEQLKLTELEKILPSFTQSALAENTVSYKFTKINNQVVLIINALIKDNNGKANYIQRQYTFDPSGKIANLHYVLFR